MQRRWLKAEFGDLIELKSGDLASWKTEVLKIWAGQPGRRVGAKVDALWKLYGGGKAMPRAKEARVVELHEILCKVT